MKLNFYQAWHYHYIAKIKQPFKLWLKAKKQGKMKFFGEVMENRMYDVPEADDNEEFQKWLLNERKNMKKEDRQIEWKDLTVNDKIGFYNGKKLFKIWLHSFYGVYNLCYVFKKDSIGVNTYNTLESAKRGAERFLSRLQEAVK